MIPHVYNPFHWHIHKGYMRWFLAGPGVTDWWPLTKPFQAMGDAEYIMMDRAGQKACAILNVEFRGILNLEPHLIRATLLRCGWTPDELTSYPDEDAKINQAAHDRLLFEDL